MSPGARAFAALSFNICIVLAPYRVGSLSLMNTSMLLIDFIFNKAMDSKYF